MNKIFNFLMGDKAIHFLYCFMLTVVTMAMFKRIAISIIVTILIAVGKELYDKHISKTGFNSFDIVADVTGMVCGAICCSLILSGYGVTMI